ncbi:ABC transporter ATP-binding protein [Jeotgalicoccus huakuii]|uniref:ABC transporter ATP-binding protein n=1 Tax=Jeotgalicoccus TaxID=227979 RepID=UPI000405E852|nr:MULTISPECIES: ABC transporter ATP-binding protein [Jeotgalicoccus]MCK1976658.1 ABC transporter ATP-binding protein [Jeotgalicoccus huakuii]
MSIIKVNDLEKNFGSERALKGVSFEMQKGQIFGLLGPSGSGKTTTIKVLTGEFEPNGGTVIVNGFNHEQFGKNDYVSKLGILSDKSSLYERLTVKDNLELFRKLYGAPKGSVESVLKDVGLADEIDKTVSKLSKGMKQRILLCKAVIHKPDILFLDEPTSALDPTTAEKIHEMLEALRDEGTTVLLTTHNMDEATRLCDNVAFLYQGVIQDYGSPSELRHKYKRNVVHVTYNDGSQKTIDKSADNEALLKSVLLDEAAVDVRTDFPTLGEVFKKVTGKELY